MYLQETFTITRKSLLQKTKSHLWYIKL